MSYNVKNGTGMDGRRDYDRTARVIAEENRMSWPFRSWTRDNQERRQDTLQELAARTTLTGTYAKAIDYSGGSYGVGILSRESL
ncbi:MAG: endonuclease/exonuclease/phosphatase family protein [Akkermansia sp.]